MKRVINIVFVLLALVILAVGGLVVNALLNWDRTFDVAEPALNASKDPATIARGKYLVESASACAGCHVKPGDYEAALEGTQVPLAGGRVFKLPPVVLNSPNITPAKSGIGDHSDGQIARAIRHGVRHDGRAMFPMMEYQGMSDEDIVAVISYLRTLPAVENEVPSHDFSMLGKILMTYVIEPVGPKTTPPARVEPAVTKEYGEYLANHVSVCVACHSPRDEEGNINGARFSGGWAMENHKDPNKLIVSTNLTPDPETGGLNGWDEDTFISRFRNGEPSIPGSPMPWGPYSRMSDDDLEAIYLYLTSLEPVRNTTEPRLRDAPK